jgi:TetR/AcrR family transcriptional regulator, cholesterol catabolism regulator
MKMETNIINRSSEMYLRLGFKSVTMDDVASEMGISKKTIYQYFSNKRELVEAVINSIFTQVSNKMNEITNSNLNPIEKLFKMNDFLGEVLKNENTSPFYQLQKFYPQIYKALITNQLTQINECLIKNLKRGIDQGLYRKEINMYEMSRFYLIGINGIHDLQLFNTLKSNKTNLQSAHLEYHLRAICTTKGIQILESIIKNK